MPLRPRQRFLLLAGSLVGCLVLCLVLWGDSALARKKPRLAVFPLKSMAGIEVSVAQSLTGMLSTALHETNAFTLINREDIEEIAQEHEIELQICSEEACMLQLGMLLGAEQLVSGDVGKVFDGYIVNVRLVEVSSDTLQNMVVASEQAHGTVASFRVALSRLANKMAGLTKRTDSGEGVLEGEEVQEQTSIGISGVAVGELTSKRRGAEKIPKHIHGVMVTEIDPMCDAATAGLESGDVILSIDDHKVTDLDSYFRAVAKAHETPGQYDLRIYQWFKKCETFLVVNP